MKHTKHSLERMQQRAIPPIVHEWLDEFAEDLFVGNGVLYKLFTKKSKKIMESKFGRHFVQENKKYLNVYRVESSISHDVITIGWKYTNRTRH